MNPVASWPTSKNFTRATLARTTLAPMQIAPNTLRVCGECGVLSARRKSACLVCNASSLSARAVRSTPGASWVRATASFTCRSCGQRAALDGLDVDGTVTCSACHLTQAFDVEVWSQALDFAHGLA